MDVTPGDSRRTAEQLTPAAERWLGTFPPQHHGTIEAWFRHSSHGADLTPEAVLARVTVLVGQALSWAATPERRQLCDNVLLALRCDQDGAAAYAKKTLEVHDV